MAKHTTGPWLVKGREIHWHTRIDTASVIIAKVAGSDEEADANARLIAAAPEMLEALKATRAALDDLQSAADEHNRATAIGGKHQIFNEAMEAAEAASDSAHALIAKAEGLSPSTVGGR